MNYVQDITSLFQAVLQYEYMWIRQLLEELFSIFHKVEMREDT